MRHEPKETSGGVRSNRYLYASGITVTSLSISKQGSRVARFIWQRSGA
jgi:hypothetical protein